jgi:hypothetical protein
MTQGCGSTPPLTHDCRKEVTVKDSKSGISISAKGYSHRRDYALSSAVVATDDTLIGDQILINRAGTITVSLADVPPGKYKLLTYHNNGAEYCGMCAPVKVSSGSVEATKFVRTGNHMTRDGAAKASCLDFQEHQMYSGRGHHNHNGSVLPKIAKRAHERAYRG